MPLYAPRPYVVRDLPPTSTVSSPMRYEESSRDSTLNGTASILSLSLFHWNRAPSREGMNILFPKIWRTERGHENLIAFDLIVVVNHSGTWFLSWEIFHIFDHQQQGGYNEQIIMDRDKGTDNTETLTNQLWVCVWHDCMLLTFGACCPKSYTIWHVLKGWKGTNGTSILNTHIDKKKRPLYKDAVTDPNPKSDLSSNRQTEGGMRSLTSCCAKSNLDTWYGPIGS